MHWIKDLQLHPSKIKILLKFPGQNQGSESHSIQTLPLLVSGGDSSMSAGSASTSSWSSSWSWLDNIGNSNANQTTQATAWGLVIVTATLEGRSEHIKILGYLGRCRTISLEARHNSNNWFLCWS
ncbi:hypothetical protein Pyn_32977 [Prunus yedoensis var. nudiflora]|uniref:Uncharacterized protein n=1 Tax=Prunus yedoensis var. nudiflora TaxID=2094558 RepID=A0A314YL00_PRUYE|nr:hypothetical protein Pyn_32977 [Prunus yedoensis var. nudiflora]